MKKAILSLFLIMLLLGSLIVFMPNAAACHNKSVVCSPSTEQDIIDDITYMVEYELDVKLTPGCGSQYWVGFTADPAPNGWSMKLYKKGDSTKAPILGTGTPPDGDHNNWAGWIPAGSGSEVHYYAKLEVKVINTQIIKNNDYATITVNCWSCDVVPNDRENDPVTTTTTLNIPFGIRLYHQAPYMATQWVYPDPDVWAEFDLGIKDIGNASGLINLSKSPMGSSPCLETDWAWEITPNPATLPNEGITSFKLKVKPPADAEYDDYALFIVKAESQKDPSKYYHTIAAKTIVTIPLPDLSIQTKHMKCLSEEPCAGDTIEFGIDVYNLGDIAVSDFDLIFKINDPGAEQDIRSMRITDTLDPGEKIFVKCPWVALEGDHSICIHIDENNTILEKEEEDNNEAGMIVNVGPAKPKNIIITAELDPLTCLPGAEFTVEGDAKFNPEYDSLPVTDCDVVIKIVETDTTFSTSTDNKGKFTKTCTAPDEVGSYYIEIKITFEDDDDEVTITSIKDDLYITVATFLVDINVEPRTVVTQQDVTINGRVKKDGTAVAAAEVTIELIDDNDNIVSTQTTDTDPNGFYTKKFNTPLVAKYTIYDVFVTATKGEITGSTESVVFVDIDTDGDTLANSLDSDDDGDLYPDTLEENYGYDPLDPTNKPLPVAHIKLLVDNIEVKDDIIDEGDKVTLDPGNSYSPVNSELSFQWDFGDGSALSGWVTSSSIEHPYNSDGEYTIILTVRDDTYSDDITVLTDSTHITITVNDLGPIAEIRGHATGEEDTVLSFNATYSTIGEDKIISYAWDFGDGTTGAGEEVTHQWSEPDTYTVTLTVTDSDGSTNETTLKVIVTKSQATIDDESADGKSAGSDSAYVGIVIAVVVAIVVVLLVVFMMMRKKKPTMSSPYDNRVSDMNAAAQESRRPTTQFAEIKPAMPPSQTTVHPAVPGTVPQAPAMPPVQQSQLPPVTPQTNNYQTPANEQRDWSWNLNE